MLLHILGFVRDMLIASLFGVDAATDEFFDPAATAGVLC